MYKDTATAAECICDTKLELPVETEILIPDYLPQVFKIVKCIVTPVVLQKQLTAGRLTVEGYLRCTVLYQSEEDESLCQMEQKIPFTKQLEAKEGSWGPVSVLVSGETEYINCRAVNQRRIDLRGAFALSVSAAAQAQSEIITALSGAGIHQKTEQLSGSRTIGVHEKFVTAEERITFEAPPEMILNTQCSGMVAETKLLSGKAVLKGEVLADVVYRTAPGHDLLHAECRVPFNEVLDIEGADEECSCFASAETAGCTITAGAEGEEPTISVSLLLTASVYRPVEYTAVSDAFSTEYETELTPQEIYLEQVEDVFTQQTEAVVQGRLPDENAKIIDASATVLPIEVTEQDGETVLRGRVAAHLLCINALDEIDCYDKVCEYTLPRHYPWARQDLNIRCVPVIEHVTAQKTGEETSAAVVLTVYGMVSRRIRKTVLGEVRCTQPLQRQDEAALRIYFAQEGEDLFDIAKRYAASPEEIAAANDTQTGILQQAQRLLIPSAH